jgi:hypothetical protein
MKWRWSAVLVLSVAWPLAHHALVERAHVSRWELGGFGMYAVPDLPVEVTVRNGRGRAVDRESTSELVRSRWRELEQRSRALGTLASAEPLAQAILRERPELERVEIHRRFRTLRAHGRLYDEIDIRVIER